MKADKDIKIVIIGMGFLMEYIMPGYRSLLGENLATHVVATTVDEKDIERKRRELPFRVELGGNDKVLREVEPDIILFAPQPFFAGAIAEEELKPYYQELREAGKPLPDLYCFPPNPAGKFYLDTIGSDIHVCNIIPNMVSKIGGEDVSQEAYTMITIPDEAPWPKENYDRLNRMFLPLGYVVDVGPKYVISVLAGQVCAHNLHEVIFTMVDGLKAGGHEVDYRQLASAMRYYFTHKFTLKNPGKRPCDRDGVDDKLYDVLKMVTYHWYRGIIGFLSSIGMEEDAAAEAILPIVNQHIQSHQVETREALDEATANHATKGGVLEMGCKTFAAEVETKLFDAFKNYDSMSFDDTFAQFIEDSAYEITHRVSDHGYKLGSAKPEYLSEHHAVLFGLLCRAAEEQCGTEGLDAISAGVAQYGRERGGRMAQRCKADGRELCMRNYLCYGEWRPKPGAQLSEVCQKSPIYSTHATKCGWNDAWKKHGLSKYGPYYCNSVDKNLVWGFNPTIDLKIYSFLSEGADYCHFEWTGFEMTPEEEVIFKKTQEEVGDKYVKNFEYHTAHLYFTLMRVLEEKLGEEKAEAIGKKALHDYEQIFKKDYMTFLDLKDTDWTVAS